MRRWLEAAGLAAMAVGAITVADAVFGPAWLYPPLATACVAAILACFVLLWRSTR